jgi:cell division initiation protein
VPYTPVELRHVKLGRSLFGYKREETERLLDEVANSFEDVWRDRGELADKVEELERDLAEYKQREHLLTQTLVAAERAAGEAREAARKDAELIVAEAHQEARSVTRAAQAERERLAMEARRIETLLRSALGLLEESRRENWPERSDTREFEAVDPGKAGEDAGEPGKVVELPPAHEDTPHVEGSAPGRDFNWG